MSQAPRADLWFSICLIAFGIGAFVESWRMPRLENLGIDPVSAPGVTPGLIAIVISVLGALLFVRSVRTIRNLRQGRERDVAGSVRVASALLMCLVYALGLVGQIDFTLATGLFVFAFCLWFSDLSASRLRRIVAAGLLAVPTAVAVTLLFERVFLVRLP